MMLRRSITPAAVRPRRRRGFTLPEVLAALVLIGIVLPSAMHGLSLALSAASHARHATEAAILAEMKLNELVLYRQWTSGASGDFDPDWPRYRWTCQTRPREFGLTELELQVTWNQAGRDRSLRVATFVRDEQLSVLP
jgi:prepilin-type N-terminal cleavage/methylation domain-containing protein